MEELDNQPKKMCIFCHAQVAVEAKMCPFCRAQFDQLQTSEPEEVKPQTSSSSLSEKQTLDSLYPPPYQPKMEKIEEEIEEPVTDEVEEVAKEETKQSPLLSIFVFSLGSQLLVFSFFLLLFSEEGLLLLRWKASLWYLYSLVAIGFLVIGYKLFSTHEFE